ncbi:MAG TPA: hypothetical protein VFR14_06140, partial [Candidatus Limnocylindrales bacterium]|nr:hypothetical protein [Candidatus Limnocylindrales bacterium]
MTESDRRIALDRIREARAFIDGRVNRTPVLTSRTAAAVVRAATGVSVADDRLYVKAEHLQRTGSFKARGMTWRVATLS